jgi:hypothetical protein
MSSKDSPSEQAAQLLQVLLRLNDDLSKIVGYLRTRIAGEGAPADRRARPARQSSRPAPLPMVGLAGMAAPESSLHEVLAQALRVSEVIYGLLRAAQKDSPIDAEAGAQGFARSIARYEEAFLRESAGATAQLNAEVQRLAQMMNELQLAEVDALAAIAKARDRRGT